MPPTCKLLITSRPKRDIDYKLGKISKTLRLRSDEDPDSSEDVRLFLEQRFGFRETPKPSWPDETQIVGLVDYADGLFIFANTVIDYVLEGAPNSNGRLKSLLENLSNINSDDAFSPITALYMQILYDADSLCKTKASAKACNSCSHFWSTRRSLSPARTS